MRCDDSVARTDSEGPVVLRRSRGYVPRTIELPRASEVSILACGAHLKNTFCLVREDRALLSHHIGDLENMEAFRSFEEGIVHFRRLFQGDPKVVVHDLHPEYYSTRYAHRGDFEHRIGIQHHYAHLAACLAENRCTKPAIGVCFDGTGYGEDHRIWGGEFLIGNLDGYLRAAHLEYMPLPGGDAAVKNPWQTALGYLWKTFGENWEKHVPLGVVWPENGRRTVEGMLRNGINCPETSSMGRLFDAVAALVLGIREITYEGEAAILLEMAARRYAEKRKIPSPFTGGKPYRWDWEDGDRRLVSVTSIVRSVTRDLRSGTHPDEAAYRFHRTLADVVLSTCRRLRESTAIDRVAFSGGTFQNLVLLEQCRAELDSNDFTVLTHHRVPPNDGGIAFGQAAVAAHRFRKKERTHVSRHTCKSPRA
jgi:hydrogenase maturation protein HypF